MTERVKEIRADWGWHNGPRCQEYDETCFQCIVDHLLTALAQAERERDEAVRERLMYTDDALIAERDALASGLMYARELESELRAEVERLNQALADLANESVSTDHVEALEAALARVRNLAADLTNQFALRGTHNGKPVVISGCLSDMEAAFAYFGIPDPCPEAEFLPRLRAALEGRG